MMKNFMTRMTTNEALVNFTRTVVKHIKNIIFAGAVAFIFYMVYVIFDEASTTHAAQQEVRMNAICPPLLTITRSARDTLIVMKAEPLCNTYVLEHLK